MIAGRHRDALPDWTAFPKSCLTSSETAFWKTGPTYLLEFTRLWLILPLLLMGVVYMPPIKGTPGTGIFSIVFLLLYCVCSCFFNSIEPKIRTFLKFHIFLIPCILFHSFVGAHTSDFSLAKNQFMGLVLSFLAYLLFYVNCLKLHPQKLARIFMLVLIFNVSLMVAQTVSAPFRDWLNEKLVFSGNFDDPAQTFRQSGLSGIRGSQLSLVILFLCIICLNPVFRFWQGFVVFFVSILGIIISGRTGLVGIFLFLFYQGVCVGGKERRVYFCYMTFAGLGLFGVFSCVWIMGGDFVQFALTKIVEWSWGPFQALFSGSVEVSPEFLRATSLFAPDQSGWCHLFGNGRWASVQGDYIGTDSGYMRLFLFGGILGSILTYLDIVWKICLSVAKEGGGFVFAGLLVLIANFKEPFLISQPIYFLLMCLFFSSMNPLWINWRQNGE